MDEQAGLHVEDLLRKAEWIRSLARSLARDPDRAEDLAQSTIALALEHRPAEGVPRRRWFAAVMRNLLRQDLRSSRRRQRREERAARPETVPSENELLDRLEVQRRVVEAVRALEEPFRSTVLLRYFEGLSPSEIEERTGTPMRTVHSRLNRAHHLLRGRLDAEFGDRRAWLVLLLPSTLPTHVGGGATLFGAKLAIAAGIVGIALVATWRLRSGLDPRSSAKEALAPESIDVHLADIALPSFAAPSDPSTRAPIASRAENGSASTVSDCCKKDPEDASSPTRLYGHVIDLDGHAIEDALVYCSPFDDGFDSGVRTRKTFDSLGGTGGSTFTRGTTTFAANFVSLGTVRDPRTFGQSLDGSRSRATFDPLDRPAPIAVSGAGGRFEIETTNLPNGSVLHARKSNLVSVLAYDYDTRNPGPDPPVLVLAKTSRVAGIVVDEQGRSLSGIEVFVRAPRSLRTTLGLITDHSEQLEAFARTGEDGRFEIANAPRIEGRRLFVTRDRPDTEGRSLSVEPETDLRIEFRLEPELAVPVHVLVLDESGSPVAGARVGFGFPGFVCDADGRFVLDAAHAKAGIEIVATAPGYVPARERFEPGMDDFRLRLGPRTNRLSGRVIDSEGKTMSQVEVGIADPTPSGTATLEVLATHGGDGLSTRTITDSDGRFELGGFLDRPYSLTLVDHRTLRTCRVGPILAGGGDVELRFQNADRVARIAGRVVDASGAAVPGADVWLGRPLVRIEGKKAETIELRGKADAGGSFEFPSVSLDVQSVGAAFPGDVDARRAVAAGEDLEHLVVVAYRRAHFRIDLSATGLDADAFEILDPAGERMSIFEYQGSVSQSWKIGEIVDGQSETRAVAAAAETLVLERAKAEVARIPIHLVPGELTVLRP